jgi:hypothetical protein
VSIPSAKGYQPSGPLFETVDYLVTHPTMQFAAEVTLGPEWLTKRIATMQAYITGMESLDQAMKDMQLYTDQAAAHMVKVFHYIGLPEE